MTDLVLQWLWANDVQREELDDDKQ